MKNKLLIFIPLIAVILFAVILPQLRVGRVREAEIADFVLENKAELEAVALDCLSGENTADMYKNVELDGVFGDIVQFYYDGFGLAPSSRYYGFYYSRDDLPRAYQGIDQPLEAVSENKWRWDEERGDNGGITKRITDNWFYYEAWF